jgi:hypothetical protein
VSPPTALTLVSCSACSLTLKMEATCSSETSADFQRTTQRYIPEDRILHNQPCENLKFCMSQKYLISVHALLITIFSRTVSSNDNSVYPMRTGLRNGSGQITESFWSIIREKLRNYFHINGTWGIPTGRINDAGQFLNCGN